MGLPFRPPANAAQVIYDLKQLTPAPLEETFRATIAQVLSVGTFHGSLDYDAHFETAYVENGVQTATHRTTPVVCAFQDTIATLTAPQMTPGKLVRQIIDPVLSDVFETCPSWTMNRAQGEIWHTRLALKHGLNVIVEVRAPLAEMHCQLDAAPGAFAVVQVVPMN